MAMSGALLRWIHERLPKMRIYWLTARGIQPGLSEELERIVPQLRIKLGERLLVQWYRCELAQSVTADTWKRERERLCWGGSHSQSV